MLSHFCEWRPTALLCRFMLTQATDYWGKNDLAKTYLVRQGLEPSSPSLGMRKYTRLCRHQRCILLRGFFLQYKEGKWWELRSRLLPWQLLPHLVPWSEQLAAPQQAAVRTPPPPPSPLLPPILRLSLGQWRICLGLQTVLDLKS